MTTTKRMMMMTSVKATLCAGALLAMTTLPLEGAAQTTEVPLEVRGGRMVVSARTADGAELSFLVSTGSAVTVLSESGAAKIGDGEVLLGDVPVSRQGMQTIPDASLTVDGVVMDGLVSNSTLNRYDVLFDAPGGRLVLSPAGPKAAEWPGVALSSPSRLRVYHGVVLGVDVEVDGTSYPAMLELGAPALLVNPAVMGDNGITDGKADLAIGGHIFEDLPIEVSDNPVIERFSPNGDGFVLVGTPPALDCAIAVSWIHREIRTCAR